MFSMIAAGSNGAGRFGMEGCSRWLPAGWQQRAEVVLVRHGRESFEHIGQIRFHGVAATTGAFHKGIDDGRALAGGFAAGEEPVLFTNGGRPDPVLDPVVVDFQTAVVLIDGELFPQAEGVIDGCSQRTPGQNFGTSADGDKLALEELELRGGAFLADAGTFSGSGAGAPEAGLDLIKLLRQE